MERLIGNPINRNLFINNKSFIEIFIESVLESNENLMAENKMFKERINELEDLILKVSDRVKTLEHLNN